MIVIYHDNNEVTSIVDCQNDKIIAAASTSIVENLIYLARSNTDRWIYWCHKNLASCLNLKMHESTRHTNELHSLETSGNYYISEWIGYLDPNPYFKIPKNTQFATWMMSSDVGMTHSEVINSCLIHFSTMPTLDSYLNYLSKFAMSKGLFCYSSPELLHKQPETVIVKPGMKTVDFYRFIRATYKFKWMLMLLLNTFLHDRKLTFFPFFIALIKNRVTCNIQLKAIKPFRQKNKKDISIDVIIPTLGRASYLEDVLKDFAAQTVVPKKMIIIEQKELSGSPSDLTYLDREWPFEIDHELIYTLGVCNARNLAMEKITSDWVFFADDDIRFETNLLENCFDLIQSFNFEAITMSCLQKNESEQNNTLQQSAAFASGASIVRNSALKTLRFNMAFEHGFGEDVDFGMQLRKRGTDIIFAPFIKMIHLKAPVGGFRKPVMTRWNKADPVPKPSPTVMLYKIMHLTNHQLKGYRVSIFMKFYRKQAVKNIFSYYKLMKKAWKNSVYWANYLIKKHKIEV